MGFQNGYLLAQEIQDTIEAQKVHISGAYKRDWLFFRETGMNLYWRKVPAEYKTEIEGITDGIKRRGISGISLEDVVALNGLDDTISYHLWLRARDDRSRTPTTRDQRCSAFIATGKTTHDGKILIAHNTWSSYLIGNSNVIVDASPSNGKHFLMQANPGSLSSETDWCLNTCGLLITETTISGANTFNPEGTPYFVRARRAVQHANTIDEWIKTMIKDNNGGYANDWLVGDVKTGEIAMLELATFNHAIRRTFDGVFVGSNIATSEKVREETKFNYEDKFGCCTARCQRWSQLIESNRTLLDVDMAKEFLADHYDVLSGQNTPNRNTLCGHVELDDRGVPEWELGPYYPTGAYDGKVTDSVLAMSGAFWAHWGKPCNSDFDARLFLSQHPEYSWQRPRLKNIGAYPWTLFNPSPKWQIV